MKTGKIELFDNVKSLWDSILSLFVKKKDDDKKDEDKK